MKSIMKQWISVRTRRLRSGLHREARRVAQEAERQIRFEDPWTDSYVFQGCESEWTQASVERHMRRAFGPGLICGRFV